jgi:phage FluMu protein Com
MTCYWRDRKTEEGMSTRGWIGKYCPNCFSKETTFIDPATEKNEKGDWIYDKVPTSCPECKWVGDYRELIDTEEEFKNTKRTKLIDRALNEIFV